MGRLRTARTLIAGDKGVSYAKRAVSEVTDSSMKASMAAGRERVRMGMGSLMPETGAPRAVGVSGIMPSSPPGDVVLGPNVNIGSNVSMGPNVTQRSSVALGPNVSIGNNVNIGNQDSSSFIGPISKIDMPKPSMMKPAMVSNSAKGFAMSAMEQVGLTAAGGLAGGVASYSTGGDFNQGAMIGGGIAGGLTLGAGAVARKLGQDGISASGYTGALGNLLSGFEDANVRRAMIGGGGLLGGMAFGGNRSHSQGFNKNRGTKIGH